MIPSQLIEKKRDGGALTGAELSAFFAGYQAGTIPEYQMAALLMAIYFQGMEPGELDALVALMLGSGARLDLGFLDGPRVDKHSTGGVGDKVSLVLAPLAAELGVFVPMMSGRGLGHTGGTLDKLEAIPGFRTDLDLEDFKAVLRRVGCAMIGQTGQIAPLDKRLYALRDVTATVPSIPLISASIMSKKLAEDLTGLVLDVKQGSGAFIPEPDRSEALARTMVTIGNGMGVPTVAVRTAMDRPLGHAAGNALESREAMECLAGHGPPDLAAVTCALVGEMLAVVGVASSPGEGTRVAEATLAEGAALERMARLVEAQGGDPSYVDRPDTLARAPEIGVLEAEDAGWILEVAPRPLGNAVVALGGGRRSLDDVVDPRVGFVVPVNPGDRVERGQLLAEVHAATPGDLAAGLDAARNAVRVGKEPGGSPLPLVVGRLDATD